MKWTAAHLKAISPGCKTDLKEGIVEILNGKLVAYNLILANHQYVVLIIVPQSSIRVVFRHFCFVPSRGHMGEYKTL